MVCFKDRNPVTGVCFEDRKPVTGDHREFSNQRIPVHQQLGGQVSVHDRLGVRVDEKSNDQLEEMADYMVPDEDIMCRAYER
jgi:hypothetical protein